MQWKIYNEKSQKKRKNPKNPFQVPTLRPTGSEIMPIILTFIERKNVRVNCKLVRCKWKSCCDLHSKRSWLYLRDPLKSHWLSHLVLKWINLKWLDSKWQLKMTWLEMAWLAHSSILNTVSSCTQFYPGETGPELEIPIHGCQFIVICSCLVHL